MPTAAEGAGSCGLGFEEGTKACGYLGWIAGLGSNTLVFGPAVPPAQDLPDVVIRGHDAIEELESLQKCRAKRRCEGISVESRRENHDQWDVPLVRSHSFERERVQIEDDERRCLIYKSREP
jgi:hypothetical protein